MLKKLALLLRRDHRPSDLGWLGERRALWFYLARGYRLVDRNIETELGEIDLIVKRGKVVVFVEVKTRQQTAAGAPFEAVDRRKQLQVARLAQAWIVRAKPSGEVSYRFDVVSLLWNGWRFELQHFPAAFELQSDTSRPWLMR